MGSRRRLRRRHQVSDLWPKTRRSRKPRIIKSCLRFKQFSLKKTEDSLPRPEARINTLNCLLSNVSGHYLSTLWATETARQSTCTCKTTWLGIVQLLRSQSVVRACQWWWMTSRSARGQSAGIFHGLETAACYLGDTSHAARQVFTAVALMSWLDGNKECWWRRQVGLGDAFLLCLHCQPAARQTRQTDRQTRVADNSNGWNWKLCSSGTTDALVVDVVMVMMMVVVVLLLLLLWCYLWCWRGQDLIVDRFGVPYSVSVLEWTQQLIVSACHTRSWPRSNQCRVL